MARNTRVRRRREWCQKRLIKRTQKHHLPKMYRQHNEFKNAPTKNQSKKMHRKPIQMYHLKQAFSGSPSPLSQYIRKSKSETKRPEQTRADQSRASQAKPSQAKPRQNKTRQDKTRQDKTRQDKTTKTNEPLRCQRMLMLMFLFFRLRRRR
jgi:hypothetical protein